MRRLRPADDLEAALGEDLGRGPLLLGGLPQHCGTGAQSVCFLTTASWGMSRVQAPWRGPTNSVSTPVCP